MGTSKRTELATAIALIVAGAATALPAEAQSSLPVYSSDFGGPNSAAPSGAARDTYIDMGVPRLQTVHRRLLEVRRLLQTHAIPDHDHPHSHGPCVTPTPLVAMEMVTVETVDGWRWRLEARTLVERRSGGGRWRRARRARARGRGRFRRRGAWQWR